MSAPKEGLDRHLADWALAACGDWNFDTPVEPVIEGLRERLPQGLKGLIALGIDKGIVVPKGRTFTLEGLAPGKGPYNWFSRDNANRRPNPNWEYFVQVGEYVRLALLTRDLDFHLAFEDDLMDIGVYRDSRLVLCCEVKETPLQASRLVSAVKSYEDGVDWTAPDRGNDPLRKAKYILKRQPSYFSVVAIGVRHEFSVSATGEGFHLEPDIVPIY